MKTILTLLLVGVSSFSLGNRYCLCVPLHMDSSIAYFTIETEG